MSLRDGTRSEEEEVRGAAETSPALRTNGTRLAVEGPRVDEAQQRACGRDGWARLGVERAAESRP